MSPSSGFSIFTIFLSLSPAEEFTSKKTENFLKLVAAESQA